jgi:hypothetical protein
MEQGLLQGCIREDGHQLAMPHVLVHPGGTLGGVNL